MAKRKAPSPEAAPAREVPAEYTVVARRYRPQQFSELVGQEPVARALTNALTGERVAHAYLFTGARGVGKTSTARILAKALNCEKGPTPTPCDACESCKAIAAGQDVDVLEIDGASNRKIEEVRDIRQNVQFRPSRSRYKIYIIDEVHMLTREAFNALLKTLEEPPPHVKFIFATTDVQKLPITILSRCQRFDFAGIASGRIIDRLREVMAGEGREANDDALAIVARRAGGSMRDAQSLLDQLLAFGNERLTAAQVHQLLGTASDEQVAGIASAVLQGDSKSAIELLGAGLDRGLQLGELLDQLIDYWRDLMLLGCGSDVDTLTTTQKAGSALREQASQTTLDTVLAGLDILNFTRTQLRNSTRGRVLVEMAMVRLARLDGLLSLSQIAALMEGGGELVAGNTAAPPAPPSDLKKKTDEVIANPSPPRVAPLTAETLPGIWEQVLSDIGPIFAAQLSRAGSPAISGPNCLVLQFPAEYNKDRAFCANEARLAKVAEAIKQRTGQDWVVRMEAASGTAVNGSASRKAPKPAAVDSPRPASQHPLLAKAEELLSARLMQVEDGFGTAPETSELIDDEE